MPKFKVQSDSKHSPNETFVRIRKLFETDQDLKRLDSSYACQFNDQNLTGTAKGDKFNAGLKVMAQSSGSQVEIEVDLPLMLTPVKGLVQSTLQKKLDSALS